MSLRVSTPVRVWLWVQSMTYVASKACHRNAEGGLWMHHLTRRCIWMLCIDKSSLLHTHVLVFRQQSFHAGLYYHATRLQCSVSQFVVNLLQSKMVKLDISSRHAGFEEKSSRCCWYSHRMWWFTSQCRQTESVCSLHLNRGTICLYGCISMDCSHHCPSQIVSVWFCSGFQQLKVLQSGLPAVAQAKAEACKRLIDAFDAWFAANYTSQSGDTTHLVSSTRISKQVRNTKLPVVWLFLCTSTMI